MRSALLFCSLLLLTALSSLLESPSFVWVGLLLVAWALFLIFRFAWIAEFVFWKDEEPGHKPHSLPGRLLGKLSRERDCRDGYLAARVFGPNLLFWLSLGGLYVFWICFVSVIPQKAELFVEVQETIRSYFFHVLAHDFDGRTLFYCLQNLVFPSMVGLIYLNALSFSGRPAHGRLIGYIALLIFAGAMFLSVTNNELASFDYEFLQNAPWIGYSPERLMVMQALEIVPPGPFSALQFRYYSFGLGGVFILYMLCGYMVFQFLPAFFRCPVQAAYAVLALGVLAIMLMADSFVFFTPALKALWLSGWVVLAILQGRCRSVARKVYKLRQH